MAALDQPGRNREAWAQGQALLFAFFDFHDDFYV
jgi:hypothetical protein